MPATKTKTQKFKKAKSILGVPIPPKILQNGLPEWLPYLSENDVIKGQYSCGDESPACAIGWIRFMSGYNPGAGGTLLNKKTSAALAAKARRTLEAAYRKANNIPSYDSIETFNDSRCSDAARNAAWNRMVDFLGYTKV